MLSDARWITKNPKGGRLDAPMPYIRKSFTLSKEIRKAELNICAVGYGICLINGKNVTEDVLTTPMSNYDVSVYYNTYDVTSLLAVGKNSVGVMLGNGIYNDANDHWGMSAATWRDFPKVILELSVTYSDGGTEYVRSDASFRVADGPLVYNNARCGEDYDARLEQIGWAMADFDDSAWERAAIKPGTGGILKKNMMPPIRKIRKISAKHIGNGIYDLGENISGWVGFRVRGSSGDTVRVVYAERLSENGEIDNKNENDLIAELGRIQSDSYTLRGGENEAWEPRFTYHGFRYFTVETNAETEEVWGVLAYTDLKTVGSFECSDETLNKLHAASVKSTLTCFHSIPEDCPHREQNGWTGDALLSAEQAIFNFDMTAAYRQWLSDLRGVQRANGQLPCICPNPGRGWYGSWDGGPAWDGAVILIPYYVWKYTGDKSLIAEGFDAAVKYLGYLDSIRDGYILNAGLGDWNPPRGKRISHKITATCYYHTLAKLTKECAETLGKDPAPYDRLAANIRADYRAKLLSSDLPDMKTQSAIACGIYHGMYDEDEIPNAVSELVKLIENNGFHTDCGCLGTKAMFTVLSEYGHADLLLKMILNPTAPSYAYWIKNGMTTLCERWNMEASRNHHYFSEIDHWFYKYLAGIRLCEGNIEIKPLFVDGIDRVRAEHRGISVYYDKEKLVITVPKTAKLILGNDEIPLTVGTNEIPRK